MLRVPVEGELELRVVIARCREKNQRVFAGLVFHAPQFTQAELVAVEVQRCIEIAYAYHRV